MRLSIPHNSGLNILLLSIMAFLLICDFAIRQILIGSSGFILNWYKISLSEFGIVIAIVSFSIAFLSYPFSVMADRWGHYFAIISMGTIWAIGALTLGYANSFDQLVLGRMLIGVGEAAFGTVGLAVFLSLVSAERAGFATGIFLALGVIGSILGISIGGTIHNAADWQTTNIALCSVTLIAVALFAVVGKSFRPLRRVAMETTADKPPISPINTNVLILALASGFGMCAAAGMIAWLPTLAIREYGLSQSTSAWTTSVAVAFGGLGMLFLGWIDDYIGKRYQSVIRFLPPFICLCAFLLAAAGLACETWSVTRWLLWLANCLTSGVAVMAVKRVKVFSSNKMLASSLAILAVANNLLGMAAGPWLVGYLAGSLSLAAAMITCFTAILLSAVLFALIPSVIDAKKERS